MSFTLIYLIVLPLVCYLYRKDSKRQYIPFILLVLLSAIRYDTTSDYHNYVRMFWEESSDNLTDKQVLEFGYVYLNKLFGFTDWGFIGVLAVASLFTYFSFFPFFKNNNIICFGVFVFISLNCFTNCDNIVRQSISMACFNYSIYFYHSKKKIIALLFLLAAPMFHISAYVLFGFLPLIYIFTKRVLPKWFMFSVVILLLILYAIGFFEFMQENFFAISFIINSIYGDYNDVEFSKGLIGIAFLIKTILCVIPVMMINKETDRFTLLCVNMSWFSIILRIVFSGIPFFFRIADYLSIFNILAISMCLSFYFQKMSTRPIVYLMSFLLYFLLSNSVIKYYGVETPYQTIFSTNCAEHRFYVRQTFEDVQMNGIDNKRKDHYVLIK